MNHHTTTTPAGHPDWCARGHHCNLHEHRAAPIGVDLPGHGRAALTRISTLDGREYAEVRITFALSGSRPIARYQLLGMLTDLRALLTRATVATRHRPHRRTPR